AGRENNPERRGFLASGPPRSCSAVRVRRSWPGDREGEATRGPAAAARRGAESHCRELRPTGGPGRPQAGDLDRDVYALTAILGVAAVGELVRAHTWIAIASSLLMLLFLLGLVIGVHAAMR